jgi:hypothetical protein
VYTSVTKDNPFLSRSYLKQLEQELDPKIAQRMLHGEWIEIAEETIYYQYSEDNQVKGNYEINQKFPIHISFDFNIGEGKPLSACIFQYINDTFYVFDELIIEGARTLSAMEELANRKILDYKMKRGHHEVPMLYYIHGDATGQAGDTKALHSDYEQIENFLSNYNGGIRFQKEVPRSNPPDKTRHNTLNAYCKNLKGEVRLFVYVDHCPVTDEGMRLTALKKGGQYVEDDTKYYQHVTTALGYGILSARNLKNNVSIHNAPR